MELFTVLNQIKNLEEGYRIDVRFKSGRISKILKEDVISPNESCELIVTRYYEINNQKRLLCKLIICVDEIESLLIKRE